MIIYFNNKLLYVILYVLFINILLIMYLENCMTFLRIEINIIITIQKKKKKKKIKIDYTIFNKYIKKQLVYVEFNKVYKMF